jgi:2-iminobutanoate/2-iminopropanoate deaminase
MAQARSREANSDPRLMLRALALTRIFDSMKLTPSVLAAFLLASAAAMGADPASHKSEPGAAQKTPPPPPFSETLLAGDTLYVSGHLGLDPKTGQAVPGSQAEAKAVMDSFVQSVKAAGLTADDLVSVTVYCSDISLFDTFNAVYRTYFHGKYPTRAFIGVAQLLRGAHFEVQGIAVKSAKAH